MSGLRFRYFVGLAAALAISLFPVHRSGAQGAVRAGDGYLLGTPAAQLNLRAGYARASARGDLFEFATDQLTLSRSDFSGPLLNAELAIRITPRIDASVDAGYAFASAGSEFRRFLDNNDQPIQQTTTLQRVPLTTNLKVYLAPRGRAIGKLAWVPATLVPWIGVGGGAAWYRFRQQGDFVNFTNNNVFDADLVTSGWTPVIQGMGGVDLTLSPRFTVGLDARTMAANGSVGRDFSGFDKIDLSGTSITVGVTLRM